MICVFPVRWLKSTTLPSSNFYIRSLDSQKLCSESLAQCWNHWAPLVSGFYCRSSECLNGFSVGWQYSGCVQPLFWSGNVVSVGIWPDHSHNSHWEEGQFAPLEPELYFLSVLAYITEPERGRTEAETIRVEDKRNIRLYQCVCWEIKTLPRNHKKKGNTAADRS